MAHRQIVSTSASSRAFSVSSTLARTASPVGHYDFELLSEVSSTALLVELAPEFVMSNVMF